MAMYMDCSGLTDVEKMLNKLGEKAQGIAALGLYEGAGVMADEIKKARRKSVRRNSIMPFFRHIPVIRLRRKRRSSNRRMPASRNSGRTAAR